MRARVESLEYLGADLVLRCRVGSEPLMVRTAGSHWAGMRVGLGVGLGVGLHWPREALHFFDGQGRRCAA